MTVVDPAAVKAGDLVEVVVTPVGHAPEFIVKGQVWTSSAGALFVGNVEPLASPRVSILAHQPAPRPERVAAQFGHALVDGQSVHGFLTSYVGPDYHPMFVFPMPDGGYLQAHGDGFSDFVPDETRPLPTRDELADAIKYVNQRGGDLMPHTVAAKILAYLRGESR